MSAIKFRFKHSTTSSAVPTTTDIDVGELALNVPDAKVFLKTLSDQIVDINQTTDPSYADIDEIMTQVVGGTDVPLALQTIEGLAAAMGNNPNLYQTLNGYLTALEGDIDTLLTNHQVDVMLSQNTTNETRSAIISISVPYLIGAEQGKIVQVNFSGFKLATSNRDNVLGVVLSASQGEGTMQVITAGESSIVVNEPDGTVIYLGLNGQPTATRPTRNKVIQLGTAIGGRLVVYVKHFGHVDETIPSEIPLIKNPDTTADTTLDVISAGRHSSVIWHVAHVSTAGTYYGVYSLMHDGFTDSEATQHNLVTLREHGTLPVGTITVTYSSILNEFSLVLSDAQEGESFVRRVVL